MKTALHICALMLAPLALAATPTLADSHRDHPAASRKDPPPGLAKKPAGLPPGQAKKAWSKGERLPVVYLQPRYYITQPVAYRLPQAPSGYRWALVDDRAYLVQPQSGTINQVIQIAAALLNR